MYLPKIDADQGENGPTVPKVADCYRLWQILAVLRRSVLAERSSKDMVAMSVERPTSSWWTCRSDCGAQPQPHVLPHCFNTTS